MSIVSHLENTHQVVDCAKIETDEELFSLIELNHDKGYLEHLSTVHEKWVSENLIAKTASVLPECFVAPTPSVDGYPPRPVDLFALPGYYAFDMSSGIAADTWNSALASASLASHAAKELYSTQSSLFALTRPPGHHCDGRRAGGYCYINNIAVAFSTLHKLNPKAKIAILDLDLHHGNGTQALFYTVENPCYISLHGENEFPYYTGFAHETGSGQGQGHNLNIPLPKGTVGEEYMVALNTAVEKIKNVGAEYVLVSMGFDTFEKDPMQVFLIRREDYKQMGTVLKNLGLPTLFCLEGGYCVEELGQNVEALIQGFESS